MTTKDNNKYTVLFAIISNETEGIFVEYVLFGGITTGRQNALSLAKHIVNDKKIRGAIITKIVPIESSNLLPAIRIANSYFRKMAIDIYDIYEKQN